jgi:effector-binding domain-containing protein
MVKIIIIVGGVIVILAVAVVLFFVFFPPMPDVSAYESLITPRIVSVPAQKMIEMRVKGVPAKVLPEAFSALFQVYYGINETPKGPGQQAPRLRCPVYETGLFDTNTELEITVGIPVPAAVSALPDKRTGPAAQVTLNEWEYGDTAEILHKGPYEKEGPTIQKLLDFIKQSGYVPAGIHEEEYLIGPGMGNVSTEKYYTIIRYPVNKAEG